MNRVAAFTREHFLPQERQSPGSEMLGSGTRLIT